jgi:hypothetical protein
MPYYGFAIGGFMPTAVRRSIAATALAFFAVILSTPASDAKSNVDLNPDFDFTQYKTFAFIGGVEHLAELQVNPRQLRDTVHDSVARELAKKGLREVRRDENPDLAVRYLAESNSQVNFAGNDDWGGFDRFTVDWWASSYTLWYSSTTRQGSLMIDLIDVRRRDLAWRLFLQQKILNVDKLPEKIDKEITKGLESYPPTEKDKEEIRKEHARHASKPKNS